MERDGGSREGFLRIGKIVACLKADGKEHEANERDCTRTDGSDESRGKEGFNDDNGVATLIGKRDCQCEHCSY